MFLWAVVEFLPLNRLQQIIQKKCKCLAEQQVEVLLGVSLHQVNR